MDSTSHRKKLKREFSDKSANGTPETVDNDILSGLCDDLLLGEVVPQFPWYKLPALAPLSRWWAHAMTHYFPYYARLQNPRILSNSLLFFHTPSSVSPEYNAFCIWLYSDDEGTLRNFPVPAVPEESRSAVKFMRDDNDERIYSFTPLDDDQMAYDVSVVDLRDGSVRWQKLAQLPIMEDQVLWNCSSFDNGGRCTTYHIVSKIIEEELLKIIKDYQLVCTLHVRNDVRETQSQYQFQSQPELGDTRDLINKLVGESPPLCLEISVPFSDAITVKYFYHLCGANEYRTFYSHGMEGPEYLLMQFDNDSKQESSNSCNSTLYFLTGSDVAGVREVNIFKLKLDAVNSKKIEEESELDVFWGNWFLLSMYRRQGCYVTKVSSSSFLEWEKRRFNIEQDADVVDIKVAPNRGLHVYRMEP